jgi:hypothetical protein
MVGRGRRGGRIRDDGEIREAFFAAAIVAGFLVTDARRYLASRWLWAGCAAALLIWAPNLVWEARHHFVSFDFLRSIHARDVSQGRTQSFLPDQIDQTIAALWIAGLFFVLRTIRENDFARWVDVRDPLCRVPACPGERVLSGGCVPDALRWAACGGNSVWRRGQPGSDACGG